MRRVCSAFLALVLILGMTSITLALWSGQARATTHFRIDWLDMSTNLATGNPVPIGNTGTATAWPSQSTFELPRYGNVRITVDWIVPDDPPPLDRFIRTRNWDPYPQTENGTIAVGPVPLKYSWTTNDWLFQLNYDPGDSDPLEYGVTYEFLNGHVLERELFLGVWGLGRLDFLHNDQKYISTVTVDNHGVFLGDWNLGTAYGPTAFAPGSPFVLYNSLPGTGSSTDGSFNTDLGVVGIIPAVNELKLHVTHIGQDGFAFTVGRKCPVDAWMQDKECDDGREPDPCPYGTPMWMSDDIRVSHSQLPVGTFPSQHEDPIAGQENYVYVRVRSIECGPINGEMALYWAHSCTGLAWDPGANHGSGNWAGSPSTGDIVHWAGVNLPEDPPPSTVVEFKWIPPAPGNYCLLARFPTYDDPMYAPEGPNVYLNTWNNNNIVWKNVIVLDAGIPDKGNEFLVRNVKEIPASVDLEFNAAGGGSGIPFLDGGSVRVVLSPEMCSNWMGAGGEGQGIIVNPDDSSISLTSPLAKLQGIPMGANEAQPVTMYFTAGGGSPTPTYQRFVVSQFSDGQTTPDGGVTFEFRSSSASIIPTLTEWGAIIFGALLLASVVLYIWRRRRVAVA